jgi:hypothetical protein
MTGLLNLNSRSIVATNYKTAGSKVRITLAIYSEAKEHTDSLLEDDSVN